jgi:predicted neuraminidase
MTIYFMKSIIIVLILFIFSFIQTTSGQFKGDECIVKSEFIFLLEDVPFPSCHASTIVQSGDSLLAAWFGGTAERNQDVVIWLSRYKEGKWSKPVEVADGIQHKDKRYPCWNPVLYNTGEKIMLFFKVGPSPSEWWGELMISEDNGKTWSLPCRLPEDIIGPVKNKPLKLVNGYLICPSSTEDDGWKVHMEFTPDNGFTWERTPPLNNDDIRAIQPTILLHTDGSLQILCRSTMSGILSSRSADNGRTWSDLITTSLPNPNSGIDALTLNDDRHLVVYNHLVKGRNMLNVAISENGTDWEAALLLENDEKGTEYSYPAVIQTDDGLVHITYTWNRKMIKHVVIDPSKIITRSFKGDEWPLE